LFDFLKKAVYKDYRNNSKKNTVEKECFSMRVKAGSWSMLSPEEKLLLLTVISNQSKKPKINE
jgi:hypothetical protein